MMASIQQLDAGRPRPQTQRLDWHNASLDIVDIAAAAFGVPADQLSSAFDEAKWRERKDLLLSASSEIQSQPHGLGDVLYLHPYFALANLPHHEMGAAEFSRAGGAIELQLQMDGVTGTGLGGDLSVPQGAFGRLALLAICTMVHRSNSVQCGSHRMVDEMLDCLGLDATDANRNQLAEQLHRLVRCSFRLCIFNDKEFCGSVASMAAAASAAGTSGAIFNEVLLPRLVRNPVCLDRRAIVALLGSTLSIDVYCWLSKLLPGLEKAKPFNLTLLRQQFGDPCIASAEDAGFVTRLLAALREVLTVFPEARVLIRPRCLVMLPLRGPSIPLSARRPHEAL